MRAAGQPPPAELWVWDAGKDGMPARRSQDACCVYCGAPTRRPLACRAHCDLPLLDWRYARELRDPTTGHWRPR